MNRQRPRTSGGPTSGLAGGLRGGVGAGADELTDLTDLTNLGLGALAVALAGCGLLWLAGQAALVMAGLPRTHAPFASSPGFAVRVLASGHVHDAWRSAYPHAASPPAGLVWANLTVLVLLACGLAVLTIRLLGSPGTAGHRGTPARWATARHERRIAVPRDPARRRWRLVAGRGHASHRLLAGEDCVSAVILGPNGSGKTTSLIVPNALDWDGPLVLTTAKAHDLEPICTARARRGPVWIIAPGGLGTPGTPGTAAAGTGHTLTGWSPVAAAHDPEAADRIAEWMVDSSGMAGDPKARPWNAQARKYLKGLLLAAHHATGEARPDRSGGGGSTTGIGQWVAWIHAGEKARDHVEDILRTAGHDATAREYGSTWAIHEEGKGSVLFTALGLADTYTRPGILAACQDAEATHGTTDGDRGVGAGASVSDGFTPERLLDECGTVCLVTPNSEGDRFAPYFTTLLSAILHTAETRAAATAAPLEPRLLLALDEAGNVFRYPRLPHLLTTARGNGIQLLLIYHDLAQIEHLYGGREVARTVLSNAKLRMLLPGVGDLDTLRYWSDLIGHTRVHTHGTTTGADGHRSRSRTEHHDHLAPIHQLQQLPDGHAVLLYQNLPPAQVRLQPWYADPRYRRLRRHPGTRIGTGPGNNDQTQLDQKEATPS
jgi:type IV secretion system protein VirD4